MPPTAAELAAFFDELWPLNRSLTGDGVRRTHDILARIVPLQRREIPSGTKVFDWSVPKEWVVRQAYIVTPDGNRIADVADNTLHLVGYSVPFSGRLSRQELELHLHSRPDLPDAIPYVTSYYSPRWGFCIPQTLRDALPDGEYTVVVDTVLIDGSMTISEAVLPGETDQEIFFSTYTCHPSMANNELSGPLVAAFLYRHLAAMPQRRYTYRFAFLPETIGAIAYLAEIGERLCMTMAAGYVVTCCGDPGPFTYKRSRRGESLADRAALAVLREIEPDLRIRNFDPANGSDERQYCSPGFNLPVGAIMRTMYGEYSQYHTSLDDRSFIDFEAMAASVQAYIRVVAVLEANRVWINRLPYGEPHLGPRGLYQCKAGLSLQDLSKAIMWLLNYADGDHDLLAISELSGCGISLLIEAAEKCRNADILDERPDPNPNPRRYQ